MLRGYRTISSSASRPQQSFRGVVVVSSKQPERVQRCELPVAPQLEEFVGGFNSCVQEILCLFNSICPVCPACNATQQFSFLPSKRTKIRFRRRHGIFCCEDTFPGSKQSSNKQKSGTGSGADLRRGRHNRCIPSRELCSTCTTHAASYAVQKSPTKSDLKSLGSDDDRITRQWLWIEDRQRTGLKNEQQERRGCGAAAPAQETRRARGAAELRGGAETGSL